LSAERLDAIRRAFVQADAMCRVSRGIEDWNRASAISDARTDGLVIVWLTLRFVARGAILTL